jgi:alpha-L-rhamnosidase
MIQRDFSEGEKPGVELDYSFYGDKLFGAGRAALALVLFFCMTTAAFAATTVANLRCEYAVNPLGVDAANPRLFWTVESGATRPKTDRLSNPRRLVRKKSGARHRRFVGQRQSGLRRNDSNSLRRRGVEIVAAGLLESARVGRRTGKLPPGASPATWTMGVLKPIRLAGKMDWRGADTNIPKPAVAP